MFGGRKGRLGAIAVGLSLGCVLALPVSVNRVVTLACQHQVRLDAGIIVEAASLYGVRHERFPSTEDGISVLVSTGYLSKLPTDPWLRPYGYEASEAGDMMHLWTLGKDGRVGGDGSDADVHLVRRLETRGSSSPGDAAARGPVEIELDGSTTDIQLAPGTRGKLVVETPRSRAPSRPSSRPRATRVPEPDGGITFEQTAPFMWDVYVPGRGEATPEPCGTSRARIHQARDAQGKPRLRIDQILPGSLYERAGFEDGDVLLSVNDHSIATGEKALEIYAELECEDVISVEFERDGEPLIHIYMFHPMTEAGSPKPEARR